VKTPVFMVLGTVIPVLRKCRFKNLQKIPFEEGQVQDSIPVPPSQGSRRFIVLRLYSKAAL
jgi:hypothetical protein